MRKICKKYISKTNFLVALSLSEKKGCFKFFPLKNLKFCKVCNCQDSVEHFIVKENPKARNIYKVNIDNHYCKVNIS